MAGPFTFVAAVVAYSNLVYPHRSLAALTKLRDRTRLPSSPPEASDEKPERALRRRLGSEALAELVAAKYRAGATSKSLAATYVVSSSAILGLLDDAGVTRKRRKLSETEVADLVHRYEQRRQSVYVIESETGIPTSTVARALEKAGVTMRPRGNHPLHRS